MATKPPADVNYFEAESQIKKLYSAIDELKETVIVDNDRNRLSFCLNLYFQNEISSVYEAIVQAKPSSSVVDFKELESLVENKFKEKGIN